MFDSREKIAVFIDGANLYATGKALGYDIDYRRLADFFHSSGYLLRISYYTAILESDDYVSIRPLIDWLDYNNYTIVTKYAKEYTNREGLRKIKGNMDIELAVDAINLAPHVDHIVLFSGDGDFTYLVKHLQSMGKKVTVMSTSRTKPPMVSDDLRRQADSFIDMFDEKGAFGKLEATED